MVNVHLGGEWGVKQDLGLIAKGRIRLFACKSEPIAQRARPASCRAWPSVTAREVPAWPSGHPMEQGSRPRLIPRIVAAELAAIDFGKMLTPVINSRLDFLFHTLLSRFVKTLISPKVILGHEVAGEIM